MGSSNPRAGQAVGSLLVLMLFLLCPVSISAHTLYVYAQVEGTTIAGWAYFPGNVPARKTDVIFRDAAGRELGRTMTNEEGKFTLSAREHADYYLVAETPDGHSSRPYVVHASELPDSLPEKSPPTGGTSRAASQASEQAAVPALAANGKSEPGAVGDELAKLRTQIQELRRQVSESDERFRFRDILGGIGFILGLAGVAFFMTARRSRG